jgi:gluconate 5-dehydrogenase
VGKEMMKQRSGSIINISSTTGVTGVDPVFMQTIGYQASKAAVNIITKQLAIEWGHYNIRVNAIAPFFFPTRLTRSVLDRKREKIVQHIPMGRIGKTEEIKGAAVFLASQASSYITGQIICLDGGVTAW